MGGSSVFIVGNGGTILFSSTGDSFVVQTGPVTNDLHGVYFASIAKGWAVGGSGKIEATTDGGGTVPELIGLFPMAGVSIFVILLVVWRRKD
jgi:photosystem II stability/assembly factor-like uncharacterized protein